MNAAGPALDLLILGYVLEAIVIPTLAWRVARTRRYHRHVAAGLTVNGIADAARAILAAVYFDGKHGPYVGVDRIVFHVDEMLYLAGPASVAWMAIQLFHGSGGAHVIGGAALGWVMLVLGYPSPWRGGPLLIAYASAHGIAVFLTMASILGWYKRNAGRWLPASAFIPLLYMVGDALDVVGPFAGDPWGSWESTWRALLGLHLMAAMIHVVMLLAKPTQATR